jgi:hypothetical protein
LINKKRNMMKKRIMEVLMERGLVENTGGMPLL